MIMTYFPIKHWLSNCIIICDRPSITVIQTIHIAGLYTCVYYSSTFTNGVIISFWEVWNDWFGVCLWSPLLLCWWERKGMPNNMSLSCIASRMRQVWVLNRRCLSEGQSGGHTLSLEAVDQAIVGQQVKHCHYYMMLNSSIRFPSGFYQDSGWLTLDAKWLV